MGTIDDLRGAFETAFARRLAREAGGPENLPKLRSGEIVDAAWEALHEEGRARALEVAPVRRGLGEVAWELVWGRNLQPNYTRLSSSDPKELFQLELVAEVSELGFRAEAVPESVVEEAALDLAKLVWARAPLKALVFGAHRAKEPASSLDALFAGLTSVIAARDRESDYLLAALPNLGPRKLLPGNEWTIVTRVVRKGSVEPPQEKALASLF